jgi:hypothetical protein
LAPPPAAAAAAARVKLLAAKSLVPLLLLLCCRADRGSGGAKSSMLPRRLWEGVQRYMEAEQSRGTINRKASSYSSETPYTAKV